MAPTGLFDAVTPAFMRTQDGVKVRSCMQLNRRPRHRDLGLCSAASCWSWQRFMRLRLTWQCTAPRRVVTGCIQHVRPALLTLCHSVGRSKATCSETTSCSAVCHGFRAHNLGLFSRPRGTLLPSHTPLIPCSRRMIARKHTGALRASTQVLAC